MSKMLYKVRCCLVLRFVFNFGTRFDFISKCEKKCTLTIRHSSKKQAECSFKVNSLLFLIIIFQLYFGKTIWNQINKKCF